jgi:hypothetical protein
MKKLLLPLYSIIIGISLNAQDIKFDELISIKSFKDNTPTDTIINGIKMMSFSNKDGNQGSVIMRLKLDSKDEVLSSLPSDRESLIKTYKQFITGNSRKLLQSGFVLYDSNLMNFNGLISYKFDYVNPSMDSLKSENLLFILNEYSYVFTHVDNASKSNNGMDDFLNSILINTESNPTQTIGKSRDFKIGYIAADIFLLGLVIYIIIRIIKRKGRTHNADNKIIDK